ncbi:MAG: hypothetical protein ACI8Q1_000269 [Parvicella sp.]|jgi:hypothetical protein
MKDDDLMKFGEHKGIAMANVPDEYLFWFWGENKEEYYYSPDKMKAKDHEVMVYIEDSFEDLP